MTTLPEHQSVDDCRRSLLLPRLKQLVTLRREVIFGFTYNNKQIPIIIIIMIFISSTALSKIRCAAGTGTCHSVLLSKSRPFYKMKIEDHVRKITYGRIWFQ